MAEEQWLHLFTSNIRELYIADAVNLLAVPQGFVYQFRYGEEHVEDAARAKWRDGKLEGTDVVVYFSLQHAANLHSAAYVPLRLGKVVDSFVEGKTYIVRFEVGEYAPLPGPSDAAPVDKSVHDFSDAIRNILKPSYPDFPEDKASRRSASLSDSPRTLLAVADNQGEAFAGVVTYMTAALQPEPRWLFRVSSVWQKKRSDAQALKNGFLRLTAGKNYTVELAHLQPSSQPPAKIQIECMDGVQLLTPQELDLTSRYDVMPVRLFVPFRDDEIQGEIIFRVEEPAKGPTVRIPVQIQPTASHAVGSPLVAVIGGTMAVIPATLGSTGPTSLKVAIAAGGALLLGLSATSRRGKGLPKW